MEDNGAAIGAGMAAHTQLGLKRKSSRITDYYGRSYSQKEIIKAIVKSGHPYQVLTEKK